MTAPFDKPVGRQVQLNAGTPLLETTNHRNWRTRNPQVEPAAGWE